MLKKKFNLPIFDVLSSGVLASSKLGAKRIGIIGTASTIESKTYESNIRRIDKSIKTIAKACPIFVPLIEQGLLKKNYSKLIIEDNLAVFKRNAIDALILGCTHYPLIKQDIQDYLGPNVILIDSAQEISKSLDVSQFENWSELTALFESLSNRNVKNIQIDFGIVRGLDYYSGVVFEAFDQTFDIGALVGGGRYDNLPAIFGRNDMGATGVAGGVERIMLALENQSSSFKEKINRVSVLYVNEEMKSNAIKITSSLREKQIPTDIDLSGRALKKQMENSTNAKFVIIVGPEEFSKNMVVVRNMSDRSENQVQISELLEYIKKSLM